MHVRACASAGELGCSRVLASVAAQAQANEEPRRLNVLMHLFASTAVYVPFLWVSLQDFFVVRLHAHMKVHAQKYGRLEQR